MSIPPAPSSEIFVDDISKKSFILKEKRLDYIGRTNHMNVVEIIFSPTGGTWKVVNMIDRNWGENMTQIDLSNAKTDFTKCEIKQEDMVLVAMPSFGGRAPAVAIERFRQIKGNGARCTIVCVYGNRAYEDTLVEM